MNKKFQYEYTEIEGFRALRNYVIVRDMNFEHRVTTAGIILPSDDMKSEGIRPRWAEVVAVGPDNHSVRVGQWIMVEHGRWTRGSKISVAGDNMVIRKVDPKSIIFVSDVPHNDDSMSEAVLPNSCPPPQ